MSIYLSFHLSIYLFSRMYERDGDLLEAGDGSFDANSGLQENILQFKINNIKKFIFSRFFTVASHTYFRLG